MGIKSFLPQMKIQMNTDNENHFFFAIFAPSWLTGIFTRRRDAREEMQEIFYFKSFLICVHLIFHLWQNSSLVLSPS
jgi:hypothetical protein